MILVTGGTGFIGRALIRQLTQAGYSVRVLLRPSRTSPRLPSGVPVEALICSLTDERGLQIAMQGVETVIHLASGEQSGSERIMEAVDVAGTEMIAQAAARNHVQRMLYLSHLGADRHSIYPQLRAKAKAETAIQQSGTAYTILRAGWAYGAEDHFTVPLARLIKRSRAIFFLPGNAEMLIQPIALDDLTMCVLLSIDDANMRNRILSIGGPEFLTARQVIETVALAAGVRRAWISLDAPYLRFLAKSTQRRDRQAPPLNFWMDYLSSDRTCTLDTVPRQFGLMPARFERHLTYLRPHGSQD